MPGQSKPHSDFQSHTIGIDSNPPTNNTNIIYNLELKRRSDPKTIFERRNINISVHRTSNYNKTFHEQSTSNATHFPDRKLNQRNAKLILDFQIKEKQEHI